MREVKPDVEARETSMSGLCRIGLGGYFLP